MNASAGEPDQTWAWRRRMAMNCAGRFVRTVLWAGGIALALAGSSAIQAAAHTPSEDPMPETLVLRGSASSAAEAATASDPPSVLRGSPRSAGQPYAASFPCPPGLAFEPSYGCFSPGYAAAPDYGDWPDYGFWPYYGFGGFDGGRHRGFRHGFVHANRRARGFHIGHPGVGGFAHGFAHASGFGHR